MKEKERERETYFIQSNATIAFIWKGGGKEEEDGKRQNVEASKCVQHYFRNDVVVTEG